MVAKILICLLFGIPLTTYGLTSNSRCEAVAHLQLPNLSITEGQMIASGTFTPPSGDAITGLPRFCRIAATLKPTPDSNIKIELWLPETNWNGRFLGTGNGGGAGKINYGELASGLKRGFATANTDMGTSPRASAIVGHPERYADFGYRSTHEMTMVSKTLLTKFYGKPETHSYFYGCSTGGGQALMEAQHYPADYNGIVSGAPANNRTHIHTGFIWNLQATETPQSQIPADKIAWITQSVLAACAGKDGGSPEDKFLTDPRLCKFNPDSLPICSDKDQTHCLTHAQLTALKQIYAGPTNPKTGERIYTPIPLGSENSSAGILMQEDSTEMSNQFYPFQWAFGSNFDYKTFSFDHSMDEVDRKLAKILNANNPDLRPLQKKGGKIIMFGGTADPLVPYQDALNYYDRVIAEQRSTLSSPDKNSTQRAVEQTQDFFRYFLVPGMAHCGGGPGLHYFGQGLHMPSGVHQDLLTAVVGWVEDGKAPESFVARTYVDDKPEKGIFMQRPVCPYPQYPNYVGGDWKSASSYKCTEHPMDHVPAPAPKYLN